MEVLYGMMPLTVKINVALRKQILQKNGSERVNTKTTTVEYDLDIFLMYLLHAGKILRLFYFHSLVRGQVQNCRLNYI